MSSTSSKPKKKQVTLSTTAANSPPSTTPTPTPTTAPTTQTQPTNLSFSLSEFDVPNFDPDVFIDRLSKAVRPPSSQSSFDPRPLLQLFETSLSSLLSLDLSAQAQLTSLLSSASSADSHHRANSVSLQALLAEITGEFSALNARVNTLSGTAVSVGERLDRLDKQCARATEARTLLECYQGVVAGSVAVFEEEASVEEGAAAIQRMREFVKELKAPEREVVERIERYAQRLEGKMLERFREAVRDSASSEASLKAARKIATVLMGFGNGESCHKQYLGTRPIFSDSRVLESDARRVDKDSRPENARKKAGLQQICEEVVQACAREKEVVGKIFPSPGVVLSLFLQWVFEMRLTPYILRVLEHEAQTPESYVESVVEVHVQVQALARQLGRLEFGADANLLGLASEATSHFLKAQSDTEPSRYMAREMTILADCAASERAAVLASLEASPQDESCGLALEVVINLIGANAAAVRRCRAVYRDIEQAHHVCSLFRLLLAGVTHHCSEGLDRALARLRADEDQLKKHEPRLETFYGVVQTVCLMVQELERYFNASVLPERPEFSNVYADAAKDKNKALQAIEARLQDGLARCLDATLAYTSRLLDQDQKKTDFKAKDEDIELSQTPACVRVLAFLQTQHRAVVGSIDGRNLGHFLGFWGSAFYTIIYNHIQRFSYSYAGAVRLKQDLSAYETFVSSFKDQRLDARFRTLIEVSNLFMVPAANLPMVVAGSEQLAAMDPAEILRFASLRADIKKAELKKLQESLAPGANIRLVNPEN
jgi:hypothetical protein